MEYYRDPENQIYADLSYRLGRILVQYENLDTKEAKFEATLYITILQNLVANCNEYIRKMTNSERRNSIFKLNYAKINWGLKDGNWIKNTFGEEENLQNFISKIRNAVSHPNAIDIISEFPSTGYTTISDGTGVIKSYRFINSPDTKDNRPKEFDSKKDAENYIKKNHLLKEGISLKEQHGFRKSMYILYKDDKIFTRQSIIDLTVKELGVFVKHLANYLAQPKQANWDGISIIELISAA